MPRFSAEDFNAENAQRLSVIIMPRMKKHCLTPFRSLSDREKTKFNKLMNDYIQSLGEEWVARLFEDFNEVCYDEIWVDSFKPEAQAVPIMNTNVEMLLSDEQKQWEKEREESSQNILA